MAKRQKRSNRSSKPPAANTAAAILNPNQQPKQIQGVLHQTLHSGPIPAPETLEGYERVSAGAADRIITMAENQQSSRIRHQEVEQERRFNERRLGQWFAFGICLVIVIAIYKLAMNDKPWAAGILGATGIAGVASAFLKSLYQKSEPGRNPKK